ncbi:MAG TPA: hypothetical protein VMO26_22445 [Vicinamibacterales bacterium]|nr:hypothetical protein [Vicinamibacterales bacterium]
MKRNAFRNAATLAFSVTFAGAVMAQNPSPQTPQTPTTPQTRPDTQKQDNLRNMIGQTVTVSGCLAQDRASAGATPGTERAGADSDFILTNVQVRSGAPTPGATETPSTTGTPGTPGSASAAGGMKIKLKSTDDAKLKENLNKRVEVTGRLEAGSSDTTTRPGTPGAPGTPGTPEAGAPSAARGSMDTMPELQVSNVRVLEQACTPQQ